MHYNGTIYRPPIEADTFMVPVTEGCTFNQCTYCTMYQGIDFRMVKVDQVKEYLDQAVASNPQAAQLLERVYLVGGDPFALSRRRLDAILDLLHDAFPSLQVVTMYASAANIAGKSDDDLRHLASRGVNELYIGVETGLDEALRRLNKESSAEQTITQLQRLNEAGIRHRDLFMLGAAGRGHGVDSALASADLVNRTRPEMVMFTTMAAFPGSPLFEQVKRGEFEMAGEREVLTEERTFIEAVDLPDTWLRAGHALDSVPLRGHLRHDRQRLLATLDHALEVVDDEHYDRVFG